MQQPMGGFGVFLEGDKDPWVGAHQIYKHITGTPGEISEEDEAVNRREEQLAKRIPNTLTNRLLRGAGTMANPLVAAPALLSGPAGAAGSFEMGALGGAIAGGTAGALEPIAGVPSERYGAELGQNVAVGGVTGAALGGSGGVAERIAARNIAPERLLATKTSRNIDPARAGMVLQGPTGAYRTREEINKWLNDPKMMATLKLGYSTEDIQTLRDIVNDLPTKAFETIGKNINSILDLPKALIAGAGAWLSGFPTVGETVAGGRLAGEAAERYAGYRTTEALKDLQQRIYRKAPAGRSAPPARLRYTAPLPRTVGAPVAGSTADEPYRPIDPEQLPPIGPQSQADEPHPVYAQMGARQAPDGEWYINDPSRDGKYIHVSMNEDANA
jgi:hypothetical protein